MLFVDGIAAPAATAPIGWSDEVDDVLHGDLTAAAAYVTPAGGVVVTGVAPCGLGRREDGTAGFTTSLGLAKKLDRIVRNPHVALAFHAREDGYATSNAFVLVQGDATVDLRPSPERLLAMVPDVIRFMGPPKTGRLWDPLLREYYQERVFVDVAVGRVTAWPDLLARGSPQMWGTAAAPTPQPQQPPKNGTGPRVDVKRAFRQVTRLPYRLLGFQGSDGYPVVLPVQPVGHGERGLRLAAPAGLLPSGGRRAGLLAHRYEPHLTGLATRTFTGWMEVVEDGTCWYAPHTSKGFATPPNKTLVLMANGMMAKAGMRQARRSRLLESLEDLQRQNDHVTVGS